MTRVPAPSCKSDAAEVQIEAAFGRLIKLMAQQTARELAASAPEAKEPVDAAQDVLED
ncbi:hypothetical protein OEW28_02165 [Defluviimonas sp. WL0002]|uniref:Uncharacterized protein n=1 Tax=Albidovulum marisflavi TaxID=2984159 RepID=A0ABT2Z8S6_9RHOB|nr:hypothetical protein [Defluviimonas sp. WL0002]MCV2867427.1 hypothetical protein [Defluviimonas sp. WL0002]